MRNPFKNEADQSSTSRSILLKKSLEIEIAFNFNKELPVKFTKEFPVKLTGDFFYKYVTFRLIFKKSYQEGVFDFISPDPQLVQNFKPTRYLSGQFFFCI